MELTLRRRKQFSHPKFRIHWPRLRPDLDRIVRANQIRQELERRRHLELRRNLTNTVSNSFIL
jgi:hypothetical protein